MDERGQFTFYRSFWEAVKGLPKKDKLPILESIISYALDGIEPSNLTQSQFAFFLLVKPTLDSSRKKAANGKQGGKTGKANGKQSESKPQANHKQTASEKEKEARNASAWISWSASPRFCRFLLTGSCGSIFPRLSIPIVQKLPISWSTAQLRSLLFS